MNKKLRLTEAQYDRLILYINETPYDKVVKNVAKIDDIIRIQYKNSTGNFKIIDTTGGQIQMDNIDSGSANINYRYFISSTSLHGDDLQIKRVNKIKEKDKLQDVNSWKQLDVKDVKSIEILRDGTVIDKVDSPKGGTTTDNQQDSDNEEHTEEFRAKVDDTVAAFLKEVKDGKGINLNLASGVIHMCCDSRHGNDFVFIILGESPIKELNDWDTFSITLKGEAKNSEEDLYALNDEFIKTSDGGKTLDMKFQAITGNDFKEIIIKGVVDVTPVPNCNEEPQEKGEEENNIEDGETVEDVRGDAEKMMKAILNDPTMKKAFYQKPSLWNMIVAAAKGKNAKGTGIAPAKNIISQYGELEQKKKLGVSGRNFKAGKRAKFEILYNEVSINPTNNPNDVMKLSPGKIYDGEVNAYKLGGPTDMVLTNKILGISITILRQYRDLEDTFEVKIKKSIKGKTTQEISAFEKNAILRFISEPGTGYTKPTKEQPKTK